MVPKNTLSESELKDYLFMVENSVRAPSAYNTQPWNYKIYKDSIEIYPDPEGFLPERDPLNKDAFISLGCAVENLCISAAERGYESEAWVDDSNYVKIDLQKTKETEKDPLFPYLSKRQTNRNKYSGEKIPDNIIGKIRGFSMGGNSGMYFYESGSAEFAHLLELITKASSIQMKNKRILKEYVSNIVPGRGKFRNTNRGLRVEDIDVKGIAEFLPGVFLRNYLKGKFRQNLEIEKTLSSSHLVLFTTSANKVSQWINLGRRLERFLLRTTKYGISHSYVNQPCEVEELSVEFEHLFKLEREYPAIILRIGYGEPSTEVPRVKAENLMIFQEREHVYSD